MTRRLSGITARIKEVAPECESTICVIHREMLACRKMPPELKNVWMVLSTTSKHMPLTRACSSSFGRRWTQSAEIRWLSRGRSLARVVELREPLQRFANKKTLNNKVVV